MNAIWTRDIQSGWFRKLCTHTHCPNKCSDIGNVEYQQKYISQKEAFFSEEWMQFEHGIFSQDNTGNCVHTHTVPTSFLILFFMEANAIIFDWFLGQIYVNQSRTQEHTLFHPLQLWKAELDYRHSDLVLSQCVGTVYEYLSHNIW